MYRKPKGQDLLSLLCDELLAIWQCSGNGPLNEDAREDVEQCLVSGGLMPAARVEGMPVQRFEGKELREWGK